MDALSAVDQVYRNFRIVQYLPLEELKATLIQLVHEPSGARVMHVAADDPENLFCLSFQTLPTSSNGVAHILEHTVLCGSEKFPVKDPFFAMTRRSLNTYMNALTWMDFTCYPASSQVERDFYNLLEVYLDAVFHPKLDRLSFLQEGHRLSLDGEKLKIDGVVYNEMKGAHNSLDDRLWHALLGNLMPDLPYAFDSGGDPKVIPQLTHEELQDFHKTFYHPSRCVFFFYGNIPLARHLDYLAERVLEKAQHLQPLPPLPLQKRFHAPVEATARFPATAEAEAVVAFGWLTTSIAQVEEALALNVLDSVLMDHDGSPLKKALMKSKLMKQVDSHFDTEISELPYALVCKGCKAADAPKIEALILRELERLAAHPPQKAEVEAALHQLEFERSEVRGEGMPFGLTLFFRSALLKQHGAPSSAGLQIHKAFEQLRRELNLPALIRKYLLDNPHRVRVTMLPDPKLEAEEALEERARIDAIPLTPQLKERIERESNELLAYQEASAHQSLDCLPHLSLKEVPRDARDYALHKEQVGGLTVYHHPCFTNGIVYADLMFDLPHVSEAELPLVAMVSRLLTEMGSAGRSYEETLQLQQATLGDLEGSLALHIAHDNPEQTHPTLGVRGAALRRNSSSLMALLGDFATSSNFSDKERVHELLSEQLTELQTRLAQSAMGYAIQSSLSNLTSPSKISNAWSGLPYFHAARQWDKQLPALPSFVERLLPGLNPTLVLSCDEAAYAELKKHGFYGLPDRLKPRPLAAWQGKYPLSKTLPSGYQIPSPVAFTSWAFTAPTFSPALLAATELLDNVVLHREVREKGGAYGSGASYSPAAGTFHFYSYRDPHLARTRAAFAAALKTIAGGQFSPRELEEAKLGCLQKLDAPVSPGRKAITAYGWLRSGRTYAMRNAFRHKLLDLTAGDIGKALSTLSGDGTTVAFAGDALLKKEAQDLKILTP